MHSLQKQFHEFVNAKELLHDADRLLLAVSGGLDSIVMADLFAKSSWNFGIAHCNFQLRGQESDEDEVFVKKWAGERGIEVHTRSFDLGEGSTQLNARNARYDWFEELCSENYYSKTATAHHLNDSLETLLINLSRGTGVKGISGIGAKNGSIIRPLLFTTREGLRRYAVENSLEWREDSSNAKTDYDRNRIRHVVIPEMEKLNPSLAETFKSTSERLSLASEILQERVVAVRELNLVVKESETELKLDWLQKQTDFLILSEILSEFGFNYKTTKEIFGAIGKSGKQFYAEDRILTIDRNSLFIKNLSISVDEEFKIEGVGNFQHRDKTFQISIVEKDEVNLKDNRGKAYLDADIVDFPLKIRRWIEGDRFTPLGLNGTKKVSDYLIDAKVPLARKDQVRVLLAGEEIAWLIDYQISEVFKITDRTKKVLMISLI